MPKDQPAGAVRRYRSPDLARLLQQDATDTASSAQRVTFLALVVQADGAAGFPTHTGEPDGLHGHGAAAAAGA